MLHNLLRRHHTSRLCKAAHKGDIKAMRTCIAKGAEINGPGGRAMPPLFYCSSVGSVEGVKLLLDNGADIHLTFAEGGTALHHALLNKREDVALLLIDRGADIHKSTVTGVVPLHLAAFGGTLNVMKRLLREGVDIHVLTQEGQSAIYCALAGLCLNVTDPSCLRFLFTAGADPRIGGQVLEKNMEAFSESANAFFREQLEALAVRSNDEDLRGFALRFIGVLTGKMTSAKVGRLTRSDDNTLTDWWYSKPVAIPFWDNIELPVVYVFSPENDPEFIAAADTAIANFLNKTREDRLELTQLLKENCRHACTEKGIPEEDIRRFSEDKYVIWNHVTFPETLHVVRRHRRDKDIYVQMGMDCPWDKKNGIQFIFRRGLRITRVSTHDGWLTEADAHGLLDAEDEMLSTFSKKRPKN